MYYISIIDQVLPTIILCYLVIINSSIHSFFFFNLKKLGVKIILLGGSQFDFDYF
jgi:hypothetical protein